MATLGSRFNARYRPTASKLLVLGVLLLPFSTAFSAPQNALEAAQHYVQHCSARVDDDFSHLSMPLESKAKICDCMREELTAAVNEAPNMSQREFGGLFRKTHFECFKPIVQPFEVKECKDRLALPTTVKTFADLSPEEKSSYCQCTSDSSWSLMSNGINDPKEFRMQMFADLKECEIKSKK